MKHKTADEMRGIVDWFVQYEGSKKTFCQEHGLAAHTLDYWRRKFREEPGKSSGFVPLEISGLAGSGNIELHYPNGVRAVVPLEVPAGILEKLLKLAD